MPERKNKPLEKKRLMVSRFSSVMPKFMFRCIAAFIQLLSRAAFRKASLQDQEQEKSSPSLIVFSNIRAFWASLSLLVVVLAVIWQALQIWEVDYTVSITEIPAEVSSRGISDQERILTAALENIPNRLNKIVERIDRANSRVTLVRRLERFGKEATCEYPIEARFASVLASEFVVPDIPKIILKERQRGFLFDSVLAEDIIRGVRQKFKKRFSDIKISIFSETDGFSVETKAQVIGRESKEGRSVNGGRFYSLRSDLSSLASIEQNQMLQTAVEDAIIEHFAPNFSMLLTPSLDREQSQLTDKISAEGERSENRLIRVYNTLSILGRSNNHPNDWFFHNATAIGAIHEALKSEDLATAMRHDLVQTLVVLWARRQVMEYANRTGGFSEGWDYDHLVVERWSEYYLEVFTGIRRVILEANAADLEVDLQEFLVQLKIEDAKSISHRHLFIMAHNFVLPDDISIVSINAVRSTLYELLRVFEDGQNGVRGPIADLALLYHDLVFRSIFANRPKLNSKEIRRIFSDYREFVDTISDRRGHSSALLTSQEKHLLTGSIARGAIRLADYDLAEQVLYEMLGERSACDEEILYAISSELFAGIQGEATIGADRKSRVTKTFRDTLDVLAQSEVASWTHYNHLGSGYNDIGLVKEAEKYYLEALNYRGQSTWVYGNLGWLYFNQKDFYNSELMFKQSILAAAKSCQYNREMWRKEINSYSEWLREFIDMAIEEGDDAQRMAIYELHSGGLDSDCSRSFTAQAADGLFSSLELQSNYPGFVSEYKRFDKLGYFEYKSAIQLSILLKIWGWYCIGKINEMVTVPRNLEEEFRQMSGLGECNITDNH